MHVLVINQSRKKAYRKTKRIINALLHSITLRANIGYIPFRVVIQLIEQLKKVASRGISIQIYIEDRDAFLQWKCITIGPVPLQSEPFVYIKGKYSVQLEQAGIIPPKYQDPEKKPIK